MPDDCLRPERRRASSSTAAQKQAARRMGTPTTKRPRSPQKDKRKSKPCGTSPRSRWCGYPGECCHWVNTHHSHTIFLTIVTHTQTHHNTQTHTRTNTHTTTALTTLFSCRTPPPSPMKQISEKDLANINPRYQKAFGVKDPPTAPPRKPVKVAPTTPALFAAPIGPRRKTSVELH